MCARQSDGDVCLGLRHASERNIYSRVSASVALALDGGLTAGIFTMVHGLVCCFVWCTLTAWVDRPALGGTVWQTVSQDAHRTVSQSTVPATAGLATLYIHCRPVKIGNSSAILVALSVTGLTRGRQRETTLSWLKVVRNPAFGSLTLPTSAPQLNSLVPSPGVAGPRQSPPMTPARGFLTRYRDL
jgi:hypothetical protein